MKKFFTVIAVALMGCSFQAVAQSQGTGVDLTEEQIAEIYAAYDEDVAALNEVNTALTALKEQVEETFPGYAVLQGDEFASLQSDIVSLYQQIEFALGQASETGVYESLMPQIRVLTNRYLALSAGLEETVVAIQEANEADEAAVNELANAMQEFNNQVAETFPGYAVLKAEEIAAMTATIEALNTKVTSAMEAAYETGVYEGLSGSDTAPANEALMALVAGLEETVLAIQEAYGIDESNLNDLANAMQEFNNNVAEVLPVYAELHAAEIGEVNAQIEALNNKLTSAMEVAFETGVYEGLSGSEITAVSEAIIALNTGLYETAQAITEGYEADVAFVNELANAMQELNNMVDEEFPGYAELKSDEFAAMTAMIEAFNEQVIAANSKANQTGVYDGIPTAQKTEANETIIALMAGMEEAILAIQEDYAADEAAVHELAVAMGEFNDMVDESLPGYATLKAEEIAALTAAIEALNTKLNGAMEAAYNTGVYEGLSGSEVYAANQALIALVAGLEETKAAIQADYENAVALVNDYTLAVYALYDMIDTDFPAYWNDHEAELMALNQKALALSLACETALGAANQTCEYVAPAEIRVANEELLAIIEAYNEAYAAIENAAMADAEKLAAYAGEVLPYTEDYEATYIDDACILYQYLVDTFELVGAAQAEALTETAEYVSPLTDEVIAKIEEDLAALKVSGIIDITADAEGAQYFDLNGVNVQNPVSGKVYIRVLNGRSSKVLVK